MSGHPPDYFSSQADVYARYRPHYPSRLFEFLASLAVTRRLAWDVATGSGQAAVPLASYFAQVVATDLSASQIACATPHERVAYRVEDAARSSLPSRSADLVFVAQALHWLDLDAFYAEVRRVASPGGIFTATSYGSATLATPALSRAFSDFEWGTVGACWPPRRNLVGEALRTLEFPFDEIETPEFALEVSWTLDELLGYVRSWSATSRYVKSRGEDPVPLLAGSLHAEWGDSRIRRPVRWPFIVRAGRVTSTR
ncbi:MAG TPA: class I SAM-dependent methyltransferase [Gemmatimonadaceae bacterium]|nr:class I SAM-dependent methyltransferase [Gemmatimonadaceae bacterium]